MVNLKSHVHRGDVDGDVMMVKKLHYRLTGTFSVSNNNGNDNNSR